MALHCSSCRLFFEFLVYGLYQYMCTFRSSKHPLNLPSDVVCYTRTPIYTSSDMSLFVTPVPKYFLSTGSVIKFCFKENITRRILTLDLTNLFMFHQEVILTLDLTNLFMFHQEVKNFLDGYAVEDISISKKSRHGM